MPTVLDIRAMPDALLRRAKSAAALQGITMKQFVITALEKAVEESSSDKPPKKRGGVPRK